MIQKKQVIQTPPINAVDLPHGVPPPPKNEGTYWKMNLPSIGKYQEFLVYIYFSWESVSHLAAIHHFLVHMLQFNWHYWILTGYFYFSWGLDAPMYWLKPHQPHLEESSPYMPSTSLKFNQYLWLQFHYCYWP